MENDSIQPGPDDVIRDATPTTATSTTSAITNPIMMMNMLPSFLPEQQQHQLEQPFQQQQHDSVVPRQRLSETIVPMAIHPEQQHCHEQHQQQKKCEQPNEHPNEQPSEQLQDRPTDDWHVDYDVGDREVVENKFVNEWGVGSSGDKALQQENQPQRQFCNSNYTQIEGIREHNNNRSAKDEGCEQLPEEEQDENMLLVPPPPPQTTSSMDSIMEQQQQQEQQDATTTNTVDDSYDPWVLSLIGREWEIFWKQDSTTTSTEAATTSLSRDDDDDSSSSGNYYEEDWYDAKVIGYSNCNNNDSNSNRASVNGGVRNIILFDVLFVGDEGNVHQMMLTPSLVRPSARAWIHRTQTILVPPPNEMNSIQNMQQQEQQFMTILQQQLPSDTSTIDDQNELREMQTKLDTIEFPVLRIVPLLEATAAPISNQLCQFIQSHQNDHIAICKLMYLIKSQLYLRSKLAPIDDDDDTDDDENDSNVESDNNNSDTSAVIPSPTEIYLNYLESCLRQLQKACEWHYYCWKLIYQAYISWCQQASLSQQQQQQQPSSQQQQQLSSQQIITHEIIYQMYVESGRNVLAELTLRTLQDISPKAAKAAAAKPITTKPRGKGRKRSRNNQSNNKQSAAVSEDNDHHDKVPQQKAKRRRNAKSNDNTTAAASNNDDIIVKTTICDVPSILLSPRGDASATRDSTRIVTSANISIILQWVYSQNARWYTRSFGGMLHGVVTVLVEPLVQWDQYAYSLLGDANLVGQDGDYYDSDDYEDDDNHGEERSSNDENVNDNELHNNHGVDKTATTTPTKCKIRLFRYCDIENHLKFITPLENSIEMNNDENDGRVLRLFGINDLYIDRLQRKLETINKFEAKAWDCIAKVFDDENFDASFLDYRQRVLQENNEADKQSPCILVLLKNNDFVLQTLTNLLKESFRKPKRDDESFHSGSLFNVNPLGRQGLTRTTLRRMIEYRTWFLDLKYTEVIRERLSFVESVLAKYSSLPPLPKPNVENQAIDDSKTFGILNLLHTQFNEAVSVRVQMLSSKYTDHVVLFHEYHTKLMERSINPDALDNDPMQRHSLLLTSESANVGLDELQKESSVIPIAEEMLAIRIDVLLWKQDASNVLKCECPLFTDLQVLKKSMDLVLDGWSKSRHGLVSNCVPNAAIDAEIRKFARADLEAIGSSLFLQTGTLCTASIAWKERADSILSSLQANGIMSAGRASANNQLASLPNRSVPPVKVKQIDDLLQEYETLHVVSPDEHRHLTEIRCKVHEWSVNATESLLNDIPAYSIDEIVAFLDKIRADRPRGIILDPALHVIDDLLELIRWYVSTREILLNVTTMNDDTKQALDTSLIAGFYVVERFSHKRHLIFPHQFVVPPNVIDILASRFSALYKRGRKPTCIFVESKMEANPFYRILLDRIIEIDLNQTDGSPILFCLYAIWACVVSDLVQRIHRSKASDVKDNSIFSHDQAKALSNACPTFSSCTGKSNALPAILVFSFQSCVADLETLIKEGEDAEKQIQDTLAASHAILQSASSPVEEIRDNLNRIRVTMEKLKIRKQTRGILSLNASLDKLVTQELRCFEWLDQACRHAVLTSDGVAVSKVVDLSTDDASRHRIAFGVLQSLHQSLPASSSADTSNGHFAGIVSRVKVLYRTAKIWHEDIEKLTEVQPRRSTARRVQKNTSHRDNAEYGAECLDVSPIIDVQKIAELSNSPILLKVIMPREKAVFAMLDALVVFEKGLGDFMGVDYAGNCPDRVPIPEGGSLIGEDGALLLYRLTDGPIFETIGSSVASLSESACLLPAETPGKAAFEWMLQAVKWIEQIRSSIVVGPPSLGVTRLVFPGSDAKNLLQRGEAFLLHVPDDLRRTLRRYNIVISTSDDKLVVECEKCGTDHAIGAIVIRWCPFLLNALRFDVSQLNDWEASLLRISNDFLSLRKKADAKPPNAHSVLLKYYEYREELEQLFEEGSELFVAPGATLVESARNLYTSIDLHIQKHSTPEVAKLFAESRYSDSEAVTQDRFRLLDALVSRRVIAPSCDEQEFVQDYAQGPFRSAARFVFLKALLKGMQTLEVDDSTQITSNFCAFRAWEIEKALFEAYQMDRGESHISSEYREKARTLRRCLEDIDNLTLFTRVVTGDVTPDSLVRMSTDHLASAKTKKDREIATAVARKGLVLTGNASSLPLQLPKTESSSVSNGLSSSGNAIESIPTVSKGLDDAKLQNKLNELSSISDRPDVSLSLSTSHFAPVVENQTDNSSVSKNGSSATIDNKNVVGPKIAENVDNDNDDYQSINLLTFSARSKVAPPPPPPSLAATITFSTKHSSRSKKGKARLASQIVTTSSGTDEFYFSVADGTRKFYANLYSETDPDCQADGLLPDTLTEKGRLHIPEFTKFLKSKLASGRWNAISMIITTKSDKDSKEYKKYYKEYEEKQRIAMFGLDEPCSKMFLVTPKFQKEIASCVTFKKSTSTYAIVLARKMDG